MLHIQYTRGIGVLVGCSLFAIDSNLGTLVMNYYCVTLLVLAEMVDM